MQKTNKFWICIFGIVVIAAGIVTFFLMRVPANYVHIYKSGTLTETVNLAAVTESFVIVVSSNDGADHTVGHNVLEVEQGRIRMLSADCPDGTCVRQGWVRSGLMPIVCLPNRVVVVFEGVLRELNVDAVVG